MAINDINPQQKRDYKKYFKMNDIWKRLMTPEEINNLRLEVKMLIAGRDLDLPSCRSKLQSLLSEKIGRPINRNSVVMALSGYRKTPAYVEMLTVLKDILISDNIHAITTSSNQKQTQSENMGNDG